VSISGNYCCEHAHQPSVKEWLLHVPYYLAFGNPAFYPEYIYLFHVILRKTAIISSHKINLLLFLMETRLFL
jgi:hypothetical protein